MSTTRATVVDVGTPLESAETAAAWVSTAAEAELAEGIAVLNRALRAYRIACADPWPAGVRRQDALVARVGYGAGEQVADGHWSQARELIEATPRRRRSRVPAAHARLAGLLTGRQRALACEELALRARLDLDEGREREAALQLRIAFDAAMAELPGDPAAAALGDRLAELHDLHAQVAAAADSALSGGLSDEDRDTLSRALVRLEAALRARAAALGQ